MRASSYTHCIVRLRREYSVAALKQIAGAITMIKGTDWGACIVGPNRISVRFECGRSRDGINATVTSIMMIRGVSDVVLGIGKQSPIPDYSEKPRAWRSDRCDIIHLQRPWKPQK